MYACMYVCMQDWCLCVHLDAFHDSVYMHACMYVYMYVCMQDCVGKGAFGVHLDAFPDSVYMHACMYVYMYVCMQDCVGKPSENNPPSINVCVYRMRVRTHACTCSYTHFSISASFKDMSFDPSEQSTRIARPGPGNGWRQTRCSGKPNSVPSARTCDPCMRHVSICVCVHILMSLILFQNSVPSACTCDPCVWQVSMCLGYVCVHTYV
jgi:hypothetical protein